MDEKTEMTFGEALDFTHLQHDFPDGIGTRCGFLDSRLAVTCVPDAVNCPVCLRLSASVETEKPAEVAVETKAPVVRPSASNALLESLGVVRKYLDEADRRLVLAQFEIAEAIN